MMQCPLLVGLQFCPTGLTTFGQFQHFGSNNLALALAHGSKTSHGLPEGKTVVPVGQTAICLVHTGALVYKSKWHLTVPTSS